jgi:UDP-glucose 4-epimerase
MRIAVTGANGFVGHSLCPYLQQNLGAELVTLTRNPVANIAQPSFSETDDELIDKLRNVDCLIHLAARAHTNHSTNEDFERDNIALSARVAHLCVAANIPRLIYLSSIKVNGNSTTGRTPFSADELPQPEDIYGQSKLASEHVLKQILTNTETQLVIIRPPLVYGDNNKGNLQLLEKLIDTGVPLPFGNLKNQRDLVSIENLCALIALTVTHPNAANETFLASDGIVRSTKDIVQLLATRKDKNVTFFNAPSVAFKILEKIIPQIHERLAGDLQVDIEKTRSLLGWNPQN